MWNSRTGLESEQFMECQNWTVIDKDNLEKYEYSSQSHEHHDVRRKNVVTKVPKRKKICHLTVMDVSIFILKIITWN